MKKFTVILLILAIILPSTLITTVYADSDAGIISTAIDGIDTKRDANMLVIYTGNGKTGTETEYSAEAIIDSDGNVTAITDGNSDIPEGGFVLSGSTSKKFWIKNNIKVGMTVLYDEYTMQVFACKDDVSPFKSTVLKYTSINSTRAENTCIIYENKASTGTNTWGYEVVVDKNGQIVSVEGNNNDIPDGGFVISAIGTYKQPLIDAASVGMTAVLDRDAKTITIGLDKDGAKSKADLLYAQSEQSIEDAYSDAVYVDYEYAKEILNAIKASAEKIKSHIDSGNTALYVLEEYRFNLLTDKLKEALTESPAVETRNLWIRPDVFTEKAIKETVKKIYDAGFNSVCLELLFDNTMLCPMPEDSLFETNPKCGDNDVLKIWIGEFHRYGIEVHGWMSTFRVCHSSSSNTNQALATKKPEWLMQANDGRNYLLSDNVKHYYLNPALPEVCEFLTETYRYIVTNYDLDGFQLDYIRYPDGYDEGVYYGYDDETLRQFKEATGIDAKTLTKNSADFKKFAQFKADYVTAFVLKIREMLREERPDMILSAAVAPQYDEGVTKKHQDVKSWLTNGYLDAVYPMSYGTTDAFAKWTGITTELSDDALSVVMGMRDGGAEAVSEQIIAARNGGADGTAFFAYAQYFKGDYVGVIDKTLYSSPAVCQTYDAKIAAIAQIERMIARYKTLIDTNTADDVMVQLQNIAQDLGEGKLSDYAEEIKTLAGQYNSLATDGEYGKMAISDAAKLIRIVAQSRDDAKAAYRETHPLPDPDVSADVSQDNISGDDDSKPSESNDVSEDRQDASDENSDTQISDMFEGSNTFEKIFQIIMIVVVLFAAICAPIYIVLDFKKRKSNKNDIQSDSKNDSQDDNQDSDT